MNEENQDQISMGHLELQAGEFKAEYDKENVDVLATRNLVLFPGVTYPVNIVRKPSRELAEESEATGRALVVVCQKDASKPEPTAADLTEYGVLARVIKVLPLPDDTTLAIIQGGPKVKVNARDKQDGSRHMTASVTVVKESKPRPGKPLTAMMEMLRTAVEEATKRAGHPLGQMMFDADLYQKNPTLAINSVATNTPIAAEAKMEMLAMKSVRERGERLITEFAMLEQREQTINEMRRRAKGSMDERQRKAFLESEMEAIRQELYGDENDDLSRLRSRIDELQCTPQVKERMEREFNKLSKLNPQSPDYQVQQTYLETLTDLPWGEPDSQAHSQIDMAQAETTLNNNHYGLKKVKERVLEQLALIKSAPKGRAPILCLAGPPGVGKTSLGQSIADAMGRKFQRVSLGGLHDESEIRGHRRTYIGAMPGRIIEAMRRAGTTDPVIMLDEIDKVGSDYKGDPSAALLEVLDPEQNNKFHDNYIDMDYDLSNAIFITTANTLSTLSQPLLDRMEVVQLSGYTAEEKVEIAKRHLYPRLLTETGLDEGRINFTDEALMAIVQDYTSESGVRQLQKKLAAAMRKCVLATASGRDFDPQVTPERLHELLGVAPMSRDRFGTDGMAGVVTGLAWTAAGGEVLYIEAITVAGKGDQLSLTGNLGDVMKESATIARRYVQANADKLGIAPEALTGRDLHIHVPEGAIPKDGPSAGITMATAIASALSGRPVKAGVAMTGELTLRGRVLPVGGIKEKMLAARRAGITDIYLSADNRRNVEEIEEQYRKGLNFHYVDSVTEVISEVLQ